MSAPLLIGLIGQAGAGKSTVAYYLEERHGYTQAAFADGIVNMLCALFSHAGIPEAYMIERSLKEQPTPLGFSYRHLAQTLGTEWGRNLDPDFWLRVMEQSLVTGDGNGHGHPVVISDVRFTNEANWVAARGGVLVRIDRPGVAPVREHLSEALARTLCPHHTLYNHGSIATLHDQVDRLLDQIQAGGMDYPAQA